MKLSLLSILVVMTGQTALALSPSQVPKVSRDNVHLLQVEDMHIENIFLPDVTKPHETAIAMASGWLPSPCYHSPYAEITRVGSSISITVKAINDSPGRICVTLAVPYLLEIPLGVLRDGCYLIEYGPDNLHSEILTINTSRQNSEDNLLHAHVERVNFDRESGQLKLSGRNPSDCIELDRINVLSNGSDTYTIWPVMKQIRNECPKKLVPFEYSVNIPNELETSQILFHVRTLEGGNRFVNYLESSAP